MKNFIFLTAFLLLSFAGFSQGETKIGVNQLEKLGPKTIMVGTANENTDTLLTADIVEITDGTFAGQDVQEAFESLNTAAGAVQSLEAGATAGEVSISGGNSVTIIVDDADADATNELQTVSRTGNDATLSGSNSEVDVSDDKTYEYITVGSDLLVNIAGQIRSGRKPEIHRNGVPQTVGSASRDVSVSGQNIIANQRDWVQGDQVTVIYIAD